MIQKHKILLNPLFTGSSVSISSTLIEFNNYQVNNIQGLGGGIVNFSNVRAFLYDKFNVNSIIIEDFFSYMTGNTTSVEYYEIYNSDQKLSDVFNSYYNASVVNNTPPPPSTLEIALSETSGILVEENQYFNYNGTVPINSLNNIPSSINNSTRKLNVYSALTTSNSEDSYFIPIFIKSNIKQMNREKVYFEEIINLISEDTPNDPDIPNTPKEDS